MIFIESRDERKRIGVEKKMEDTELEEGEACYHQNGDDSILDPDALSYIDEKLQDVLGHFQKDFEGGVSAENLGAKFGGYGSFLPTYQRSPGWPQQRTPAEVYDQNMQRSPNNLDLEAIRRNSLASSCPTSAMRPGVGSTQVPHASHIPSVNGQVKRDAGIPFTHAKESTLNGELVQNSENPYDQKTLRVRIKVGSDNLPASKNAEIYSGLGLDVSPSSSEDSFSDGEGLSRDVRDAPDESPTSILKIVTSFLLDGEQLLSPLSDDFMRFTQKEKYWEETVSKPLHKASVNGCDSRKGNRKLLSEKKPNAYKKNDFLESASGNDSVVFKKETDIDTLACEELVSNALKLPLLSNVHSSPSGSAKGTVTAVTLPRAANKGFVRDRSPYDTVKEEPSEPESIREIGEIQKSNGNVGLSGNILESKKANNVDCCLVYPRKQGSHRGQSNDILAKMESIGSELGTMLDTEFNDLMKAKVFQGGASCNEYVTDQSPGEEQLSTVGRTKLKGAQTQRAKNVEVLKDGLASDKQRNMNSHASSLLSKSDSEDSRKDHKKTKSKYREFFGDLELEQEDNEVASKEMSLMEKLNDSVLVQKGSMSECNGTSNEKFTGRKTAKPSKAEEHPRVSSNDNAPFPVNGPTSDATRSIAAPLVEEDWVQCDKCQKWRLLPLGTNPRSLPEKWVCSMLNWLLAMNSCSVSEEETTQALRALYQASAPGLVLPAPPEIQSKQHDHPSKSFLGVSSAGAYGSTHDNQLLGQEASLFGRNKKWKSKGMSNGPAGVEPIESPNSVKKNLQVSGKNKSLNGVNHSSSIEEDGYQHFGQSSSSIGEKHGSKQTQKKGSFDNYSAGGDSQNSKMRNKRQSDIDVSRASKKVKTENVLYDDENCISDQGQPSSKAGLGLSSNPPSSAPRKGQNRSSSRSKSSKSDIQNNLSLIEITSDDSSVPMHKSGSKSSLKKRKGHGNQETHTTNFPSVGPHSHESSENGQRKEKKARTSMPEGKDTTTSKTSGGIDKRAREMIDQRMGQDRGSSLSQRSLDAVDARHPYVAATSSSSKVSGSCKNKTNSQELKGSPVESVSSSPLRFPSAEKFASTLRNPGKDDMRDGRFLGISSPRRFSDGEDDRGSDRSGTSKRNITHEVSHHQPVESSAADLRNRDLGLVSEAKLKEDNRSSPDFATHQAAINADSQCNKFAYKASEQHEDEERRKDDQCRNSGSKLKKLENGSYSHFKDANWSSRSENGRVHLKVSDSINGSLDNRPSCDEKLKDGRSKFQEKSYVSSDKGDKNFISGKDSSGKDLNEISKGENQSNFGSRDGLENKINETMKQNEVLDTDVGKTSKKLFPDKADVGEVSGRGKSHSLPPSARNKNDRGVRFQPVSGSHKENGAVIPPCSAHDEDTSKALKPTKKSGKQNENPSNGLKHPTPTTHKIRDNDGLPFRKDSSSQAATNAIKEAKDLKHLADRFKNSGSSESTTMYFEAALKFLQGASLLESSNNENSKHNEIQSMQVYSSTARLCGFCAHEYERSQEMAAAALAYKCMEVAYMRVIYSSNSNASRDRKELQTALQIVPPGESPSSSASDVDNLNNPATLDKISSTKGVGSPQVAANHGITAQNRSSFMRLLNYAQDVSHAMEAARKSRITFAAANSRPGEAHSGDGISSVKRALDFNFQDVDGLLRLVRIAMDAISR